MSQSTNRVLAIHEPEKFQSAIMHTAAETGFQPHLIEKDYFCTLILKLLATKKETSLHFKGGTLLAKKHAGFYRLSEDLDFTIPISCTATRKQRSKLVAPLKSLILDIPNLLNIFTIEKELTGSNESRQYNATFHYPSTLNNSFGRILVEVGLREELLTQPINGMLKTLLRDPFTNTDIEPAVPFQCLSKHEAYAEKMRAALCREKLAIRDFYDIDYAIKNHIINIDDPNFIALVKAKVNLTDAKLINFDDQRIQLLSGKIDSELVPTLNQKGKFEFDLEKVIKLLNTFKNNYFGTAP